MKQIANSGNSTTHILSEDTDVFVLLVWWVYWEEMECKVQMKRWDMTMQRQKVYSQSKDQCIKLLRH